MQAQLTWQWRRFWAAERLRPHAFVHWSVLLAIGLPVLVFVLQRDVGLNLEDEGFVWYGAQRVLAGEVPLRDFQAYDIARYYWYAAWMWASGSSGIIPLRAASAALAAISGVIAVMLVRAGRPQSRHALWLAAVTFAVWMVPYFKVADSFAALLLLAGLAALVQDFSSRRCVVYGVCLGAAATIGINHGLYGVISLLLATAWVLGTRTRRFDGRWPVAVVGGVAVGYLPMLVLLAVVPGFATGFTDSIRILFEIGTTNLDKELPSPAALWQSTDLKLTVAISESVMGICLWAAFGFWVCCAWRLFRDRSSIPADATEPLNPVFVAAVLASVPYAHYVWSRANIMHMAISALPLLVAVWTYPRSSGDSVARHRGVAAGRGRIAALCLVMLCSGVLGGPQHQLFQLVSGTPLQRVVVAGETLRLRPENADEVRLVQRATDDHAGAGQGIYVVPYWPGAYAITSRRAPTWEIYLIFPSSPERQQREIERLRVAGIGMAMVMTYSADNRADLGFSQTHALIDRYLKHCMARVASDDAARHAVLVYAARSPRCMPP